MAGSVSARRSASGLGLLVAILLAVLTTVPATAPHAQHSAHAVGLGLTQRRWLQPTRRPLVDCSGAKVTAVQEKHAWDLAANLHEDLVRDDQSFITTVTSQLFSTDNKIILDDPKPKNPNELGSATIYVYPLALNFGTTLQWLKSSKPSFEPGSILRAKVVQMTDITRLADIGKSKDGNLLAEFRKKTPGGCSMIPTAYTTQVGLADLKGEGEVVVTESFTGCTFAWSYNPKSKTLFTTHINPGNSFDKGGALHPALKNSGSIFFQDNLGEAANLFGAAPIIEGGYGESDALGDAVGFFMVTKTKTGSVFLTFQSMEQATKFDKGVFVPSPPLTSVSWKILL